MPLWRIYPVTSPEDSCWQGRKVWAEVVVRAASPAMARVIACELDRPARPYRIGNETLCFRSGLEDARLYWVCPFGPSDAVHCGIVGEPDGVVSATLLFGRRN